MTDQRLVFEGSTAGCRTLADDTLRLTIDIEPRHAAEAFKLFGSRGVCAAIAPLKPEAAGQDEKPESSGSFWQALFKCGFFRNIEVLKAIGSEAKFEEWVRQQPAVIGPDDYNPETGDIRNQPAHVRRVNEGAGTSRKPPYFAVPLSADAHSLQHQKGELYVFSYYYANDNVQTVEQAKDWLAKKADHYRTEWASRALAEKLFPGYDSRSDVPQSSVIAWAEKNDLMRFIPNGWRNA